MKNKKTCCAKSAEMSLSFAMGVFILGMISFPWDALAGTKDATKTSQVIAEWNLDITQSPLADLCCDDKTLLIVDYLLLPEDGAYAGKTSMTILDKKDQMIAKGEVELENEISTPQLLAYGKNHVYFMTTVGGKYFLTGYKLAKKGTEKVGQLQFDRQMNVELMGSDLIISTSSGPDVNNDQTLTVQVYDLKLSKKLKEFSTTGDFLSISPVGAQKVQTWEVMNMKANEEGGISEINIKLMK